jgi:hypothetical protein
VTPARPEALSVALRVVECLTRVGGEYHLGGSYASSIHGIPRQTQDVDLVIELAPGRIAVFLEALGPDFYSDVESARRARADGDSFNVVHLTSGVKFDLFFVGDSAFDRSEFVRARSTLVFDEGVSGDRVSGDDAEPVYLRVKTVEDTILRKLSWYRLGGGQSERQWTDVLGCLRAQAATIDYDYLELWARDLEVSDLLSKARSEADA